MLLSSLAEKIGAHRQGGDVEFSSVSTDTRSVQPGDLFVALTGENFDAHEFVGQAFEQGAIAAMVSNSSSYEPAVVVEDTRLGLGQLAQAWLNQFSVKKIAITGSCGKTSVKEMVAAILSKEGEVLATAGNFNNDIGVPLTLCRVGKQHRFAVVEMGANHVGEIDYVAGLVQPDVALVNNVGPAHLEGFGSIGNVAEAKSEIYANLVKDGVAVINRDDAYYPLFMKKTNTLKQITFSMSASEADVVLVRAKANASGQYQFDAKVGGQDLSVSLSLIGLHNVNNALAAVAVAYAAGCCTESMTDGLASLAPVKGRLAPVDTIQSMNVIDDSYNANPASICSAIDMLSGLDCETALVLGDMGELGQDTEKQHYRVGAYAAKQGIQKLYGLGDFAEHYQSGYEGFCGQGGRFIKGLSYQQIASKLMKEDQGKTVLIKGSRSAAMENVIHCLMKLENKKEGSL